ncbi:dTMP kinase [Humitalea sp. 24SJ18S-53]|uniref:dTMP kinase n=1 Tax=Humitalea sp. 24SJ18S-53 TaxID=3422307 RepID=UPI003D67A76F
MFITFEGGEGAGKTTQIRRLAATLAARGHPVLRTREPGGTPHAEAVRGLLLGRGGWDPMSETLLLFAARREHVTRLIGPALAAGIWVLSDRFADSTMVYQGHAQGDDRALIATLSRATLGPVWPSLTLILDIDPAIGVARAVGRGDANRFEAEGLAFHRRIRAAFLEIAAAEPARCVVIDASGDDEAVAAAVLAAVESRAA